MSLTYFVKCLSSLLKVYGDDSKYYIKIHDIVQDIESPKMFKIDVFILICYCFDTIVSFSLSFPFHFLFSSTLFRQVFNTLNSIPHRKKSHSYLHIQMDTLKFIRPIMECC